MNDLETYTIKWAKNQLIAFQGIKSIFQNENLEVIAITGDGKSIIFNEKMNEYSEGWKNSRINYDDI